MPKKKRRTQLAVLEQFAQKRIHRLLANRKAASVALSTMILTAGVLAMGIAVLYWASSWGRIASHEYSKTVTNDSTAIMERISYEYISYSSASYTLKVNVINWGKADNVSINRVYIWDSLRNLVGASSYTPTQLLNVSNSSPIPGNNLNVGCEGYFTIQLPGALGAPAQTYSIRIVTERGRNFDGTFVAP